MKRSHTFVGSQGTVVSSLANGQTVELPLVVGILKHPTQDQLAQLLAKPAVVRKYTLEALRVAPWSVLKLFPTCLLEDCLPDARLRPGRRKALEFMLHGSRS